MFDLRLSVEAPPLQGSVDIHHPDDYVPVMYKYGDEVLTGTEVKARLQDVYVNMPSGRDYGDVLRNIVSHPEGTIYYKEKENGYVERY